MAVQIAKHVQVLNRFDLKNGLVVYEVRSSNGKETYRTTFLDGKVTGCSCPSYKPCYHMTQLQERENARKAQSAPQAELDARFTFEMVSGYDAHPWA